MTSSSALSLEVAVAAGSWRVACPSEKLDVRARLPGAYGYDQAAHALRLARGRGTPAETLLPLANPVSWLVNARTPSPVLRSWLEPPLRAGWDALVSALGGGPHGWLALDDDERRGVAAIVDGLCTGGTGVAAISKVLACLCPETVPLMDDHALALALGTVAEPPDADHPTAGGACFVPTMDWFSRAVVEHEASLIVLAREHRAVVLDAAQVLDRLLWFDSWGWRLTHRMPGARYWRVRDGAREAVVPVEVPPGTPLPPLPAPPAGVGVPLAAADLAAASPGAWRDAARVALG